MPPRKQIKNIVIALLLYAIALPLAIKQIPFDDFNPQHDFSALVGIEINAVKRWQTRNGITRTLALNDKGTDVRLLQRALAATTDELSPQDVTGFFGPKTSIALKTFQQKNGLPPTGILDDATVEPINTLYLRELCPEGDLLAEDLSLFPVDKNEALPQYYVPTHLVNITTKLRTVGIICVAEHIVPDLTRMFDDAKKEGILLGITSGFRNPEVQQLLYNWAISRKDAAALNEIAAPYHSEHQLGTALDFTGKSIGYAGVSPDFEFSAEGRWLAANATSYGFVLSYPKDRNAATGYIFEPWHYRYVGVGLAKEIDASTLTVGNYIKTFKPTPQKNETSHLKAPEIAARSFLLLHEGEKSGLMTRLTWKNENSEFPIASLTKLMTALIALENYSSDLVLTVDKESSGMIEKTALHEGEHYTVDELLHMLFIESNNFAAYTLASKIGRDAYVDLMNKKAADLGMTHTRYGNVTGLDEYESQKMNASTALDTATILHYLYRHYPSVLRISSLSSYQVHHADGSFDHTAANTDKLIQSEVGRSIRGSKTGETELAMKNLALIVDTPNHDGVFISVLLGSKDNFADTSALLDWAKKSFSW